MLPSCIADCYRPADVRFVTVEFHILGPLEVTNGGVPVPVAGSRERAVLVMLLISANRVVSSDRLVEDLWGDDPPDRPQQALAGVHLPAAQGAAGSGRGRHRPHRGARLPTGRGPRRRRRHPLRCPGRRRPRSSLRRRPPGGCRPAGRGARPLARPGAGRVHRRGLRRRARRPPRRSPPGRRRGADRSRPRLWPPRLRWSPSSTPSRRHTRCGNACGDNGCWPSTAADARPTPCAAYQQLRPVAGRRVGPRTDRRRCARLEGGHPPARPRPRPSARRPPPARRRAPSPSCSPTSSRAPAAGRATRRPCRPGPRPARRAPARPP